MADQTEQELESSQGNRVNALCGDEACEEVVIPGGELVTGMAPITDVTANPTTLPTAGQAYWKRAVVIECL